MGTAAEPEAFAALRSLVRAEAQRINTLYSCIRLRSRRARDRAHHRKVLVRSIQVIRYSSSTLAMLAVQSVLYPCL